MKEASRGESSVQGRWIDLIAFGPWRLVGSDMTYVMPSSADTGSLDRILYTRQTAGMKTVSYTDARNQLASLMEAANADREPVAITRNGAASVVLVDAAEYAAMAETFHLLSSPRNADRLRKGVAEFKAGKFKKAPRG
jgi:antitoxin YefM